MTPDREALIANALLTAASLTAKKWPLMAKSVEDLASAFRALDAQAEAMARALENIMQRANEHGSGPREVAYLDTVYAMYALAKEALAAYRAASPPAPAQPEASGSEQ